MHIEEELRKSNVGAVRLDVYSKNPFALALYTRCGYTQMGTVDWRKSRTWHTHQAFSYVNKCSMQNAHVFAASLWSSVPCSARM